MRRRSRSPTSRLLGSGPGGPRTAGWSLSPPPAGLTADEMREERREQAERGLEQGRGVAVECVLRAQPREVDRRRAADPPARPKTHRGEPAPAGRRPDE